MRRGECVRSVVAVPLSTVWDRQLDERTLVYFVDNSLNILQAYVDNGEGFDRAGGFAVQVRVESTVSCPHHHG
jgi:predicted house-cleaning NTP pyrophosphatase (Maf/HAM1 superfamily)